VNISKVGFKMVAERLRDNSGLKYTIKRTEFSSVDNNRLVRFDSFSTFKSHKQFVNTGN